MIESTAVIFGLLIMFLAGLVQGATAFGIAVISLPVLVLFIDPKTAVPIIILHAIVCVSVLLIKQWKNVNLGHIWPLIVASVIGIPFGTFILISLNVNILKIIIGSLSILVAIVMFKGITKKVKNERLAFLPIGFSAGVLSGSTGMSGLPVILFLTYQKLSKQKYLATIAANYFILNIATALYFGTSDLLTKTTLSYAFYLLPATLIGLFIGFAICDKVDNKLFRKIVLFFVTISGFMAVGSGLQIF